MNVAILFVLGALLLWLAVTGKAEATLTAITGGSAGNPTAQQQAGQNSGLPGVPVDNIGQSIGTAQSFTGPTANPNAYSYVPASYLINQLPPYAYSPPNSGIPHA